MLSRRKTLSHCELFSLVWINFHVPSLVLSERRFRNLVTYFINVMRLPPHCLNTHPGNLIIFKNTNESVRFFADVKFRSEREIVAA
jgi:hypothetical protein